MIELVVKGVKNPRKAPAFIRAKLSRNWYRFRRWLIFQIASDHITAYRRWMRFRIDNEGVMAAVGGMEQEIGSLQFEFLKDQGLQPSSRLLDLGCGSFRGGQFFIDYLDAGNYVGMDVSKEIITEGKERLDDELLEAKRPTFLVNDDLQLDEISDRPPFDFMLAQSVLTHLPREKISELFANLHKAIGEKGVFYATFFKKPDFAPDSPKDFAYTMDEMTTLGKQHELAIELLPIEEYPHPRDQRMMKIQIA